MQEHPGQVLVTHFGRYRDFGLYTDSLAFYGSRMFYYVWDLPIFVGMGAIGGLMGALFIKVNVKITQFRHLYIPVRYTWQQRKALSGDLKRSLLVSCCHQHGHLRLLQRGTKACSLESYKGTLTHAHLRILQTGTSSMLA